MNVEVEDVLPAGRPIGLRQVQAVGRKPLIQHVSNVLRHRHDGACVRFRDRPDVGCVQFRNYERVAFGSLSPVKEGQGAIVFGDDECRRVADDDAAEDAVR